MALSTGTFEAEERRDIGAKSWKAFLGDLLAANFSISRSSGVVQNKVETIELIEDGTDEARVLAPGAVAVSMEPQANGLAVVSSVITGGNDPYRNVTVFSRRKAGPWRCVYWQVRLEA